MAMPSEQEVKYSLLYLLADAPEDTLHCRDAITVLARSFPQLTPTERWIPSYENGDSHWANRVRWAREHLAQEGLLHRPDFGPGRGLWRLTGKGLEFVAESRKLADEVLADLSSK